MHAYLRALGFSQINTNEEEKAVLNTLANLYTPEAMRFKNNEDNISTVMYGITNELGLALYGTQNEDEKMEVEFYSPFSLGTRPTELSNVSIERLGDRDAYEVVCESRDNGTTIIFHLINSVDYQSIIKEKGNVEPTCIYLSALSTAGIIILPNAKSNMDNSNEKRRNAIEAAKNGDAEAIDNLALDDFYTYSKLSSRIRSEDIYSIVDTSLMPCGVECDKYMVVGKIVGVKLVENPLFEEEVWILSIDANYLKIDVAINTSDLLGEPQVGRRFKGQIWLQGILEFS